MMLTTYGGSASIAVVFLYLISVASSDTETINRLGAEQWDALLKNSKTSDCWNSIEKNINISCRDLTTDSQRRLAVDFTNCHLNQSGKKTYVCELSMDIKDCTGDMDTIAFQTYTTFFVHCTTMCHFVVSQLWQTETVNLLNLLVQIISSIYNSIDALNYAMSFLVFVLVDWVTIIVGLAVGMVIFFLPHSKLAMIMILVGVEVTVRLVYISVVDWTTQSPAIYMSGLCGCLAWSRCAAAILGVCLYIRNSCRKMAVVYQQQCQLDKIQGMVENLEHLMQPHTPIAQSSPDSSPSFWKIQNYLRGLPSQKQDQLAPWSSSQRGQKILSEEQGFLEQTELSCVHTHEKIGWELESIGSRGSGRRLSRQIGVVPSGLLPVQSRCPSRKKSCQQTPPLSPSSSVHSYKLRPRHRVSTIYNSTSFSSTRSTHIRSKEHF